MSYLCDFDFVTSFLVYEVMRTLTSNKIYKKQKGEARAGMRWIRGLNNQTTNNW